jgi:hypothetical protein
MKNRIGRSRLLTASSVLALSAAFAQGSGDIEQVVVSA